MNIPRFAHKIWALTLGYYWLPCPICGEYMGGHEHSFEKSGVLYEETQFIGNITCHKCKDESIRRNKERGFAEFKPIEVDVNL